MSARAKRAPRISDDALYFCDNGMVLCGAHLGSSARHTGRDISGQRIARVTAVDDAAFFADVGELCGCEMCGKTLATESSRSDLLAPAAASSSVIGATIQHDQRVLCVRGWRAGDVYRPVIATDASGRIYALTADAFARAVGARS